MVHVKTPVKMRKIQTSKAKKPPDNIAGDDGAKKKGKVKKKSVKKPSTKAIDKEKIKLSMVTSYVMIAPKTDKNASANGIDHKISGEGDSTNHEESKDPYAFDFNDDDSLTNLPHISKKNTLKQLPLHFDGSIGQSNLSTIVAAAEYTERMHEVLGDTATGFNSSHFGVVCPTSASDIPTRATSYPADRSAPSASNDSVEDAATNASFESSFDSMSAENIKPELTLKCQKCGRTLKSEKTYAKHSLSCTGDANKLKSGLSKKSKQPFYCDQCDFKSSRKQVVARHMESEHGLYKCLKVRCMYVGESKEILDMHLLQMHKASLPEAGIRYCKKCGQHIQTDEESFNQHISQCKGKEPFVCKQCNKEFAYKFAYTNHMNSHFPEQKKKFECSHCDYSSNFKANLQKHVHCIHEQRSRDVTCPKCGKTFFTDESMKRHLKLHSDIRPFQCSVCEKTFKTRMSLREHEQIHIEGRPFICLYNNCGKDFRSVKFLKRHQLEFHNIAPPRFQCPQEGCELSFFRPSQLNKHSRIHLENGTLACPHPDCGKTFRHADNLKVHALQHTDEKPLKCSHCDYECRQRTAFNYHMSKYHPLESGSGNVEFESSMGEMVCDLREEVVDSSRHAAECYTTSNGDCDSDEMEADMFSDLMLFDETMVAKSGINVASVSDKLKSQPLQNNDVDGNESVPSNSITTEVGEKNNADPSGEEIASETGSKADCEESLQQDVTSMTTKSNKPEDDEATETENYDEFSVDLKKTKTKRKKKKSKSLGTHVKKSDKCSKNKRKNITEKGNRAKSKTTKRKKRELDKVECDVVVSKKKPKKRIKPIKSSLSQKKSIIEEINVNTHAAENGECVSSDSAKVEDIANGVENSVIMDNTSNSGPDCDKVFENNSEIIGVKDDEPNIDSKSDVVVSANDSDLDSVDEVPDTPPRAPRMPDVIESEEDFSEPENWQEQNEIQMANGDIISSSIVSVEPMHRNDSSDKNADVTAMGNEVSLDDSGSHSVQASSLNDSGCDVPRSSLNKDYLDECLEDIASMEQNASSQQAVMSNHSEHNESVETSLAPPSIETNSDINSVHNPMSVARSDVGESIQHIYEEPKQEQPYDLKIDRASAVVNSNMDRTVRNMSHQRPLSIPPPVDVFPYQRMELLSQQPSIEVLPSKESSLQRLTNITYQNFASLDINAMSRDMSYLRPAEGMYVRPPTTSFMHVSDKDTSIARPGMPTYAGTFARAPNATLLRNSTVADDLYTHDTMGCGITRSPFHPGHWPQEIRPAHWNQSPYLQPRQSINSSTSLLSKDKFFIDREYALEPTIRPLADQTMFAGSQPRDLPHDTFPLDRFDLSSYFGTHGHPYSGTTGLDYSRTTCTSNPKQFDDRLRQNPPVLPQPATDMFCGINMNPSYTFYKDMYARDSMLRSQHIPGTPEASLFAHNTATSQPTYLDPRRSFYPQTNPYAFMDGQYSASKLSHPTTIGMSADHDAFMSRRTSTSDPQIDDPYRRPMIYNTMNRFF